MCKPVKCPQCGHEFTPERVIKSGAWTPEEDELLLNGYQKERKTIAELSDELNRSQDAARNRLFVLRGGGKPKGVTASVQLSAKEFDEMRAARTEVKNARMVVEQAKATEGEPIIAALTPPTRAKNEFLRYLGEDGCSIHRSQFFINELRQVYNKLLAAGNIDLREITFRR
jgi:hypothetical protein